MTQSSIFRWSSQHNDERSDWTFGYVNWTAVLSEAQIVNGGQLCEFDGGYHAGGRHIVRRIQFIDSGRLWLVRIPILLDSSVSNQDEMLESWTDERRFIMESEIATMKHVANSVNVVPTIFGYKTFINGNPVKLPYILMQCIYGNMMFDLGGLGILNHEQKIKIRRSIASIQCQLAKVSVNKLGSLVLGPDGTVEVGRLPTSFGSRGPLTSTADYFLSWAANAKFGNLKFLSDLKDDEFKQAIISFPSRLTSAIEKSSQKDISVAEGLFPIVHRDFLLHNILFDDEYNIVGVIDWEHAHSAPLEVFTALTNMYSHFDSKVLRTVPNPDGGSQYIHDVLNAEKDIGQVSILSQTIGSILGDISLCMTYFEDGKVVPYGELLDRYESTTTTPQEKDPIQNH